MRSLLATLVMLAVAAPVASAQQCNLGVYAHPDGTGGSIYPSSGSLFDVYVVMFGEDTVDAVAYNIYGPDIYDATTNPTGTIIPVLIEYGPTGSGINVLTPGGNNVGLGVCANGFNGAPVLVAHYEFLYVASAFTTTISITRNTDLPTVQYSTCAGEVKPCDVGPNLLIDYPVGADAPSWGSVKSLYDAN